MKVIKSEFVATDANGKDWWRAIIVSDTSVDTPPTTGSGVDGMPDEAGIAAGSVLLTPDGNTVYYTDDMGGGGGCGTTARVDLFNNREGTGTSFLIYDGVAGNILESFEVAENGTVTKQVEIGRYVSPEVDPNEVEINKFGQCKLYTDNDGYYYYLIAGDCEIYVGTMH